MLIGIFLSAFHLLLNILIKQNVNQITKISAEVSYKNPKFKI